jgi:hypothetical protein
MSDMLQWAIVAFIMLGIGVAIWKGGAANPQGTGQIAKQVGAMKGELIGLSARMGSVENEMEELKTESASAADIVGLRAVLDEKISTVRAEMAGDREVAKMTYRGVERIERFLIERGLNGAR